MAAEGLPVGGASVGAPPLPGWELEAWYQDLQEVLAAAEPSGPSPPWGAEQAELPPLWGTEEGAAGGPELDAALAAELLELLGPESTAGTEPAGPPASHPPPTPPPRLDPTAETVRKGGMKRKRRSDATGSATGSRDVAQCRERANEQRVLELTAHNEQLREEIRRLSAEVQRTRTALIDRIVNLRRL